MKRIRQAHTAPELAVREILRGLGVSYRTCVPGVPGTPDIMNRRAKWAIFVHGCYWHGHTGCKLFTVPKTNTQFWKEKICANQTRDRRKVRALRALGFKVITVWQCETRKPLRLARRLARLLKIDAPLEMAGDDAAWMKTPRRPAGSRAKKVLRTVDLFSGCGGLSLGVEEAARRDGRVTEVRLAVEADPLIASAYRANFNPVNGVEASKIEKWFDRMPGEDLSLAERRTRKLVGRVDLLVGGPPCTGHSTLNNHTRGRDPKNALYFSMVRAAEVLGPLAVMVENVPALERDSADTLSRSIDALTKLGYHVDHGVVSVVEIGVPQLRKRHVLLAHREKVPNLEAAVAAARRPIRTLGWAIRDLRSRYGLDEFDTAGVLSAENSQRAKWLIDHEQYDLPNHHRPSCQQNRHKYKSMYGRLWWKRPAQTITTGFGSPGQGRYLHPAEPRTLTPHEAARIQFFPDWFDFSAIPHRSVLARAIGNAVPSKLAFVMIHHLLRLERSSDRARPRVDTSQPLRAAAG